MVSISDKHNDSFYSDELAKVTMPPAPFFGREKYYDAHQQPQSYESRNDGMSYGRSEQSSLVQRSNASKAEEPSNDRRRKTTDTALENKCAELEKECIIRANRKDHYKTKYSNLKMEFDDQKHLYKTTYEELLMRFEKLETKYNSLQTEYDNQKQSIDSLGQEMKNIQEEVSNGLVETWSSKTDDQLVKDIDRLRKSIESWSRGLDVGTIKELQDKDSQVAADLKWEMREIMPALTGEGLAVDELLELLAAEGVRKMIVTAVLSHELFFRIIGDPFFFLERKVRVDDQDHSTDETCISPRTIDAMTKFKDQEHHIHIWRSAVLRGMKSGHEVKWRDACLQRMKAFAEHPVNKLIQARSANSESQLEDVFVRAGEISYELWARRSKIEVWGMGRLRSSDWGTDIEDLNEHGLATCSVLSDSESGDALAVVHPLIWAFGTEEAKDYDQSTESRVLSKAEVWA